MGHVYLADMRRPHVQFPVVSACPRYLGNAGSSSKRKEIFPQARNLDAGSLINGVMDGHRQGLLQYCKEQYRGISSGWPCDHLLAQQQTRPKKDKSRGSKNQDLVFVTPTYLGQEMPNMFAIVKWQLSKSSCRVCFRKPRSPKLCSWLDQEIVRCFHSVDALTFPAKLM